MAKSSVCRLTAFLSLLMFSACKSSGDQSQLKKDVAIQNYQTDRDRLKTTLFLEDVKEIQSLGQRAINPDFLFSFFPLTREQKAEINKKHFRKVMVKCEGVYCYGSSIGSRTKPMALQGFKPIPIVGKPVITLQEELTFVLRVIDPEHTIEVCALSGVRLNGGLNLYGARLDNRRTAKSFLDISYTSITGSFPARACKPYIPKAKIVRNKYNRELFRKNQEEARIKREKRQREEEERQRQVLLKAMEGLSKEDIEAFISEIKELKTLNVKEELELKEWTKRRVFTQSAIRCHQQNGSLEAFDALEKYEFRPIDEGFYGPGFYRMGPEGRQKAIFFDSKDELRCLTK